MTRTLTGRAASAGRRMITMAVFAGIAATGVVGLAGQAPAMAAPPGCTSNYVVGSNPLRNESTGVASWNYGYVQLWYSNGCKENWARVVSLLGNTTFVRADLYGVNGADKCAATWQVQPSCAVVGGTTIESPGLVSPNDPTAAFGVVDVANGTQYDANYSQF